jgi:hypothetical protein
VVGQVLELDQFDLPVARLLRGNGLQRHSGIAMAAAGIMKQDVYFFRSGSGWFRDGTGRGISGQLVHGWDCYTEIAALRRARYMPCG